MATYRKSLTASVSTGIITALAAALISLMVAGPSFGQNPPHPAGDTPGGNNTGLTVEFDDAQGVELHSLRLCAGGIDRFNGVDDSVHSATITLKLMHGNKAVRPGEGVGLKCYFDGFHGGSSTKVVPPMLRVPPVGGRTNQPVPLAVGADGTAQLRVVSSNLITTANLEVKADTDGGILGKLPCEFGQSKGFRYRGVIASNPQGFSMAPRPNPPSPIGPGDEIKVYNSDYRSDDGWEYSPLVLTSSGEAMTATLHLTFQRDLSIAANRNYFLHNRTAVKSIGSNSDMINPALPNTENFVAVPGHILCITVTPYRKTLAGERVISELVPPAETFYYVSFCSTFTRGDIRNRSLSTLVTTDTNGLAVISITAGERINTCEHFELRVTDQTQLR